VSNINKTDNKEEATTLVPFIIDFDSPPTAAPTITYGKDVTEIVDIDFECMSQTREKVPHHPTNNYKTTIIIDEETNKLVNVEVRCKLPLEMK
jgi:hypothetical protein